MKKKALEKHIEYRNAAAKKAEELAEALKLKNEAFHDQAVTTEIMHAVDEEAAFVPPPLVDPLYNASLETPGKALLQTDASDASKDCAIAKDDVFASCRKIQNTAYDQCTLMPSSWLCRRLRQSATRQRKRVAGTPSSESLIKPGMAISNEIVQAAAAEAQGRLFFADQPRACF